MEIIPNIGLGTLRFGMSPKQVRASFDEPETYEDWMGGNLNDSLLFKGLILGFDRYNAHGPLARSKFREATIHGRPDVVIMGKSLLDWSKSAVIDRLGQESVSYSLELSGGINIPAWSLAFSFDDNDRLIYVEMWRPHKP